MFKVGRPQIEAIVLLAIFAGALLIMLWLMLAPTPSPAPQSFRSPIRPASTDKGSPHDPPKLP